MVTLRVFLLFELWVAFGDSSFFSSVEGCAVGALEDDALPGSEEATLACLYLRYKSRFPKRKIFWEPTLQSSYSIGCKLLESVSFVRDIYHQSIMVLQRLLSSEAIAVWARSCKGCDTTPWSRYRWLGSLRRFPR